MALEDIIRAWRDEEFRASLSPEHRAGLPAHPAGLIQLSDEELESVAGGMPIPPKTSNAKQCQKREQLLELDEYLRRVLG